jgi:hypothetical protein
MPTVPDAAHAGGACPRRLRSHLPLVPTLALIALPKCPLCAAAYLGVLGSFGGAWLRAAWGWPLTAALLVLALVAPAARAWRRQAYRPLVCGVVGGGALVVGKFGVESAPLVCVGALLLAAAALWSTRLTGTRPSPLGQRS